MKENVVRKEEIESLDEGVARMEAIEKQMAEFKTQLESLSKGTAEDKLSMIVFSGDLDKVLASFVIATGAVEKPVVPYETLWQVSRDRMGLM